MLLMVNGELHNKYLYMWRGIVVKELFNKKETKQYYYEVIQHKDKITSLHKSEQQFYKSIVYHTNYLPDNSPIRMRIWHFLNNSETPPRCKTCNNNYVNWNKTFGRYALYCSAICSNSNPDTIENIKKSVNEKYGVSCALLSPEVKEKAHKTMLRKYGTTNPLESDVIKDKRKSTVLERYGKENYFLTDEFKERMKDYDYSNKENFFQKKYGVSCPMKLDWVREKHAKTIKEKFGKHHKTLHISSENFKNLHDIDYLMEQHHTNKKTMIEIADDLGVHVSTISRLLDKYDIDKKYYIHNSFEEKQISIFLAGIGIQHKTNVRNLIDGELDIVIEDKKIAIEYCGLFWHSDVNKDKNYHRKKYELCKDIGYRLITIFQNEWVHKQSIVKNKLMNILGVDVSSKIYARNCKIEKVLDISIVKDFYENNHIQGYSHGSEHIGLTHSDKLVALMTFKKEKNNYNLVRFATSQRVIGGFSKILKYFTDNYIYENIITFADLRWGNGDLYVNNGFIIDKELKPDYAYCIRDMLYHKFNFRHNRLTKVLPNYDDKLSERQNMEANGVHRIYDCGKLRFIKTH